MIDIQNLKDERNIDIQKVGVKGLKYPIIVLDRARGTQPVNATINMYVNLLRRFKGTHMSRFVEVLNEIREQVNIRTFHSILEKIRENCMRNRRISKSNSPTSSRRPPPGPARKV